MPVELGAVVVGAVVAGLVVLGAVVPLVMVGKGTMPVVLGAGEGLPVVPTPVVSFIRRQPVNRLQTSKAISKNKPIFFIKLLLLFCNAGLVLLLHASLVPVITSIFEIYSENEEKALQF